MISMAGATKLLKNELLRKLVNDPALYAKVADRIYTLINPNDSKLYELFNKLPFIGINFPEVLNPDYYGSQQKDEDLQPRIWIYHESSTNKQQLLFDEILEIADAVINVLNYTIDLDPALEIIEARYFNFIGPETAADSTHPWAARLSFNMSYLRTTCEAIA